MANGVTALTSVTVSAKMGLVVGGTESMTYNSTQFLEGEDDYFFLKRKHSSLHDVFEIYMT